MIEQLAIQPTDIALFLVSFAACVYCIILSRRLKTLQDTRDGLGATIMAMNKSVAAVSSATRETRVQAGELTDRLAQMMREADKSCQRLSALQASVEASEGNLGRKADAVKSEVTSEMKLILQRSREEMREMKNCCRS
ncbi:DUF6468 domain-containing protein [Henriciella sp.]|uniref:DUF6468 domain-containing protein n=1 Tax=Henriciella sp. TaxID=1968823 RepID=UPI003511E45D